MGQRGPQKNPLGLRIVNGRGAGRDSGGRRIADDDAGFERGAPAVPKWLTGEALNTWRRIVPKLAKRGIIKPEDRDALAAYCLAVASMRQAQESIDEQGVLIATERGAQKLNPAFTILTQASNMIRAFAHEFGLTPASESNVARSDDGEQEDNPFAATGV